jgi:hypothetical protein
LPVKLLVSQSSDFTRLAFPDYRGFVFTVRFEMTVNAIV